MSGVNDDGHTKAEKIIKEGVQIAALIRQAAAIASAIDNALQLISNYKKQRDISDRSLKISEEERKHAQDVYWPKELEFLAEFGTPEEVEEADVYGRRFAGHLIPKVAKMFAAKARQARCKASRWCTSAFARSMQALYQAQASAITNVKIMGYCQGFAYAKAKHDLNDKRRLQAIGLARNLFGQAAGLYQDAAKVLSGTGNDNLNGILNAVTAFKAAEETSRNSVYELPAYQAKNPAMTGDYSRMSSIGFHPSEESLGVLGEGLDYKLPDWMEDYNPTGTATTDYTSPLESYDLSLESNAAWQRPGRQSIMADEVNYTALSGIEAWAGNSKVRFVGGKFKFKGNVSSWGSTDKNKPTGDI